MLCDKFHTLVDGSEGDDFAPISDNIEKRNCALVCDIIVAGAIAVYV